MSSLDINKSLIENSDYLRTLASELRHKDVNDIDSNLLYEVAYASTYLDVLLSKSTSTMLNAELLDSKSVFDTILASAPYEKVDSLKSSFDYKKLLKCRYGNIDDASYEKSYAVSGDSNALSCYLSRRLPSILIFFILVFFVFSGSFKDLCNVITDRSIIGTESQGITTESTDDSELTDTLDEPIRGSVSNETFKSLYELASTIISIILVVLLLYYSLIVTIDLVYLTLPAFRYIVPEELRERIISKSAISIVETCLNEAVVFRKVKDFNRIERNKVWLDTMLGVLDKDFHLSDLHSETIKLSDELKKLEDSGRLDKTYYLLIAKIEFLHDKYLELV